MANGRLINIAAFRAQYARANQKIDHAWVEDLPCENLMDDFAGWQPELLHLLKVRNLHTLFCHLNQCFKLTHALVCTESIAVGRAYNCPVAHVCVWQGRGSR